MEDSGLYVQNYQMVSPSLILHALGRSSFALVSWPNMGLTDGLKGHRSFLRLI